MRHNVVLAAALLGIMLAMTAEARPAQWMNDLLKKAGFISQRPRGGCPADPGYLPDLPEDVLWKKSQEAKANTDLCEPARFFKELIRQYPGGPHYKLAWRELVLTYIKAQDQILAINEANSYLDDNRGDNDSEYLHFLLLKAVREQIFRSDANPIETKNFALFALGAHPGQSEETPYLLNLKYSVFFDRYPESTYRRELELDLNEIRQVYAQAVLEEARLLVVKMEYPQAIDRYMMLAGWGPVLEAFPAVLSELVKVNVDFSWALLEPQMISNSRLAGFLGRSAQASITLEERKSLSDQTWNQAEKVLEEMKINFPQSVWTLQAESYLRSMTRID